MKNMDGRVLGNSDKNNGFSMLCDPRDFDVGQKGYLLRHELKNALACQLGFRPHKHEVEKLLVDGRVSFAAYDRFVAQFPEVRRPCAFGPMSQRRRS